MAVSYKEARKYYLYGYTGTFLSGAFGCHIHCLPWTLDAPFRKEANVFSSIFSPFWRGLCFFREGFATECSLSTSERSPLTHAYPAVREC